VSFDKGDFVGRAILEARKAAGPLRRCVAFRMAGKSAPPRPGYPIWGPGPDATRIGTVASGTQSPSLGLGIGLGYVASDHARPDQEIAIEIRGQRTSALVVRKPIYRPTPRTPPPR